MRGAIDFPLAGVAMVLRRDGDTLDDAALATMERHVKRSIQPMETTLMSVPWRRRATPVLAKRLVHRLWDEAKGG